MGSIEALEALEQRPSTGRETEIREVSKDTLDYCYRNLKAFASLGSLQLKTSKDAEGNVSFYILSLHIKDLEELITSSRQLCTCVVKMKAKLEESKKG